MHTKFLEVWELEKDFKVQTAKVAFGVIQGHWQWCHSTVHTIYDVQLLFQCNYISILHRFRDTVIYFPKFKNVT